MQIYGILLNIRGILLKTENIREYRGKSFLFFPFHSQFYPDFML